MSTQIRAFKNYAYNATELFVRDAEGAFGTFTFEKLPPGSAGPRAALLKDGDAQRLMDDLWDSGFRPTEGSGSAGAMGAVQEHLKDLRRIVFKDFPKE